MNKRDIKKIVKMSTEGLSTDTSLRVLINLCVPRLTSNEVAIISQAIQDYNIEIMKEFHPISVLKPSPSFGEE